MSKLVAVIAPMLLEKQHEADFRLLLKENDQELNVKFLYELILNDFTVKNEVNQYIYKEDTIAAAGYFLSSSLRMAGYDTILTQFIDETILQNIALKNPLAICISTTMILRTSTCLQVIRQIRKCMKDIKIIIGGIFALKSFLIFLKRNKNKIEEKETGIVNSQEWELFKDYHKEYENCIFITSHHGMNSLFKVLKEIEKGKKADYSSILNLVIPEENKFSFTHYKEEVLDINKEFIHWELLDTLPHRIPIRTSIGCPYRCLYCDFCTLYPTLLVRTMESIYKELIIIKNKIEDKKHLAMLHFTDDNIFITKKRLQDICQVIIESDVQLPWISLMRASSINELNIERLKNSNLLMAMMGIESGDPGILQAMNKKQDLREVKTAIELLDENRVAILATFITGFPGETSETLRNTAKFLNYLNLKNIFASYQLFPLKISALSHIMDIENRKKWKIKGNYDEWEHSTMNSSQVVEETYQLFKNIDNIPYYYVEESKFFNFRFTLDQRKRLFKLRKDLTVAVFEKAVDEKIQSLFQDIALTMGLPAKMPEHQTIKQLIVPGY